MSLPKNIVQGKSNPGHDTLSLCDPLSGARCTTITGGGRSAIGVIAIDGAEAGRIVARCFQGATNTRFSPGEIRYGRWTGPRSGCQAHQAAAESVVVTPLGDEQFEIHCHGGPAAMQRIVDDLKACGATWIARDSWVARRQPRLVAEAVQVLGGCLTSTTAAIALDQVRGALVRWAVGRIAELEAGTVAALDQTKRQCEKMLGFAGFTTRLNEPFRVVLMGPPNVGKSTLLNAIVGFSRSITFDAPGTTRDVLHADTVIQGLAIRLSDTAGIRDSEDAIEQRGVERARRAAGDADLVLSLSDPTLSRWPAPAESQSEVDSIPTAGLPGRGTDPLIRVLNKSDLLGDSELPVGDRCDVATNALSGAGVEKLMGLIAARLTGPLPPRGEPVAINQRQARLIGQTARAEDCGSMVAGLRRLLGEEQP